MKQLLSPYYNTISRTLTTRNGWFAGYEIHRLSPGNDTITLKTWKRFINTAQRKSWIHSFQRPTLHFQPLCRICTDVRLLDSLLHLLHHQCIQTMTLYVTKLYLRNANEGDQRKRSNQTGTGLEDA